MRIISLFLIIVALCVSSTWADFSGGPNQLRITGNRCTPSGSTLRFSNEGTCNDVCNGRINIRSDRNPGPKTVFTLYDYGNGATSCSGNSTIATFSCPAMVNNTSPTFTVNAGDQAYHITCQYVNEVTETPAAGNSADKLAVGIAIIFGTLISLLAL
ncbi:hypothetical protein ACTFIU_003304 [Dictyostelium citrinum]